jgi:glycosyltransferase involved in cell wall biosynthesis
VKILMVHTWHHRRGGDATYTMGLSSLLERAGHQVYPLAMRHPDNDPSPWEARFVPWIELAAARSLSDKARMLKDAMWSPAARDATRAIVQETGAEVAHLQHIHRHITPSVLDALDDLGVPAVWTLHDHELVCPAGHLFVHGAPCERCLGHRYHQAVLNRCKFDAVLPSLFVALEKELHQRKHVWERVAKFICPSRFLAETIVRFGVPAEKVVHVPNFLDTEGITASSEPGGGWLYAGRLTEEKGVRIALRAAAKLPEHPFFVCGTGGLEQELRAQYRSHGQIVFLGHLPRTELEARIRSAGVVVVPSLWHENFPYAVLEAQALGRAVVASRVGGIPEQIEQGVDGLLVPPGDVDALANAVRGLLEDPRRALALGAAGATRVRKNLGSSAHVARIEALYRDACGGFPSSPGQVTGVAR